jgi:hypothetical protein
MRPKYAVPFASMVAFLHPESRPCNRYAVSPPEVVAAANASDLNAVLMIPGDTWDSAQGFALRTNDYYANRDAWTDRLIERHEAKIAAADIADSSVRLPFEQFDRFFTAFLRSLPPFAGLMMKRPVTFHVASDSQPFWVLDFRGRAVRRMSEPPAGGASVIRMSEAMLADAIAKNVVGFTHISMRIRIDLAAGGAPGDLLFWGLMAIRELGYLPLHRMLTPRAIRVLWLRRAEVASMLRSMIGFQSLHKNMLGHLKSRPGVSGARLK